MIIAEDQNAGEKKENGRGCTWQIEGWGVTDVVSGGCVVHGRAEWLASARTELMGLLSLTIFLVLTQWPHA